MNELSITEKFILEIINNKPITDIKQFAEYCQIPYNTVRIYVAKLLRNNYLIKDNEMIKFNHSSNYTTIIKNNQYYNYSKMLEQTLVNNHFTTNEELILLKKYFNINDL